MPMTCKAELDNVETTKRRQNFDFKELTGQKGVYTCQNNHSIKYTISTIKYMKSGKEVQNISEYKEKQYIR